MSSSLFETERLAAQAVLGGATENAAMEALGLRGQQKALDVGCGNGAVATRLKKHFAGLEVHGIEIDPALADAARSRGGVDNVHVLDATSSEWPKSNFYDCVYARLLLQHVSEAQTVINKMADSTKEGGRVILIESDHASFFTLPRLPILHDALARCEQAALRRTPGADPCIAFRLVELARRATLRLLETRIVTISSREVVSETDPTGTQELARSLLSFLWSPKATGETGEWCRDVQNAYEKWGASPNAYFRWSLLFVAGTKSR